MSDGAHPTHSPQDLPSTLLGTFPVKTFLSRHYQKKALFLPGALENCSFPVSPEKLAMLARQAEVESRLVLDAREIDENGRAIARPWKLKEGPFANLDFDKLGKRGWTLLVQDVDKFVPEVAALLDLVSFLPRWSVDDVMISYATEGASVGPHVDRYDVFLVQAKGTRRWRLTDKVDEADLRSDTDLRVLRKFEAQETHVARPGDVLYLPAGLAHYGVAEDNCMTYSFGFRAPTESALLSEFADELASLGGDAQLSESLKDSVKSPAELSLKLRKSARLILENALRELGKDDRWLGKILTKPKPNLVPKSPDEVLTSTELRQALFSGRALIRDSGSRFLYSVTGAEVTLFVDGEAFELDTEETSRACAAHICEAKEIGLSVLTGSDAATKQRLRVLSELYVRGAVRLTEDDDDDDE